MAYTHYLSTSVILFLVAGCAHVGQKPPQSDTLRSQRGTVVVRHASPVGETPANFGSKIEVEAVRYTTADTKRTEMGVAVVAGSGSAFIPLSQIAPLADAIQRVCDTKRGVPPFENYRADYRALCGVSVSCSDRTDGYACWIEAGEGRAWTTVNGLRKFRDLLLEAEKRLKR